MALPHLVSLMPRASRRQHATLLTGALTLLGVAIVPVLGSSMTKFGVGWISATPANAQSRPADDDDDDVPPDARDSGDVDLDTFYRELHPHGTWWDHPRYGRVWTPRGVARDWKPYTRGHWARTEEHGWYWISEEEWGWAPFHYGRWDYDEDEGWFWVPGTQWGPAWVVWRESDDVVGWAPLPPDAEWDRDTGLRFNSSDYNGTRWAYAWSFCQPQFMFLPGLYGRLIPRHQHATFLRASRPIWSYTYRDRRVINGGLDWRRIERRIGQPVPTVRLAYVNSPRQSGWRAMPDQRTVPVYRPRVAVTPGAPRPDARRPDNQWGWRPQTAPDPRPGRDVVRPQGGFWGGRPPEPRRPEPPTYPARRPDVAPSTTTPPPTPGRVWRPGDGSPRNGITPPPPAQPATAPPPPARVAPPPVAPSVRQPPPPPASPPPVVRQPTPPPVTRTAPPPQPTTTAPPGPRGTPGDRPRGDRPSGDRPAGDRPKGDRPRRDGDQPR